MRVVDGLAQASCNNFSAPIQLAYSGYTPFRAQCVSGPTNASWPILPRVPAKPSVYNYTLIPITWCGQGVVKIKVMWGYTSYGYSIADGLYVSLFAPYNYTTIRDLAGILPFGGADYTPAGSSLQLFVQFNPYDYGYYQGSIEFAVMNAVGGYGVVQSTNFNPSKYWPTNTWTSYVIYNATSNTLSVEWIVPGVFDVKYAYNLNTFSNTYRFTPPPQGQYYIVVGVATGGRYANWQVYSIGYSVS